ncbi:vomeronasal type-2 receptor 26-like [Dendropsophus ebraccatus]|uniref:vomeronasal type-2 receptor 26-like n=1 Tax=Dendropsophus ebraccatus TaxID=150705 RepID=UPI003831B38D
MRLIISSLTLSMTLALSCVCKLSLKTAFEDYKYYKHGDIIIGGIFTVNNFMDEINTFEKIIYCEGIIAMNYKYFLNFLFAIEEVNKDLNILPNVTLGYHVYDSCSNANKAVKSTIQILSGPGATVPNYYCTGEDNIAGFIGDLLSVTTVPIAQLLNVYGYTQISYGATDPMLGDRVLYPYLFRTARSDHVSALVTVLKHFSWNWVGIITSADDSGAKESQVVSSILNSHGVCIEYTVKIFTASISEIKNIRAVNKKSKMIISRSSASIIIVCGTDSYFMLEMFLLPDDVLNTKTFLLPPNWFINIQTLHIYFKAFNCSLGFLFFMNDDLERNSGQELLRDPYNTNNMKLFLLNIHPSNYPDDKWLEQVWIIHFRCLSPNNYKNELYRSLKLKNCSGKENITELPLILFHDGSPIVYNALITMAYALHAMHTSLGREVPAKYRKASIYRHKFELSLFHLNQAIVGSEMWVKLTKYLRECEYTDQSGKRKYYDGRGEINTIVNFYNWISTEKKYSPYRHVGSFTPWTSPDEQLSINTAKIVWKNNTIPKSRCSENCPTGSRKLKNEKKQICCYDCVVCPEGEIANKTDSENCIKCLDTEWSSIKRDQCFPKIEEFLAFSDGLSIALSSIAVLFWTMSVLVLGIFVSHKDSPIVKANNKTLSFILLISLSLCFLCVFLFIGRPVDRTCRLRQIVFGITFSISVSSVLAKTIMVYMAFRISRPGGRWKKLIEVKVSNSIVVVATSIEVIISIIWLYSSPPYLEQDTYSFYRKVIIQCNEGSQVGFFAVLGYLFVLAAVSFTVAYLARTLPDRFNEAKYITFSMLVFCSVWITMVPSYLSTKGKNMVAVEIFSILTSSAGLLGFMFFPKCYLIVVKPQLNRKTCIHIKK